MEWYDFGLYGVFAAGYVAQVAGGTLFGHIGDRFGRRRALLISALVMVLATFAVSCLPTYEMIGVLAPVCEGMRRWISL